MKLLFDQNLSQRLCQKLLDLYPGSKHVAQVDLATAPDEAIWTHARQHSFVLVTTQTDFDALSVLHTHPPKIIRLAALNQTAAHQETLLRQNHPQILTHLKDPATAFLEIT
jgi:predicted nuclease of predicted toxin-antitoxin system